MSAADWCAPGSPPDEQGCTAQVSISSLCQRGMQRILLTGLFVSLLRDHFANIETGTEELDLVNYVWRDGPTTSILIETVYDFKPQSAGHRPALLVRANAKTNKRLVLNDLAAVKTETGRKQHTVQWIGSHTVLCLQGSGASADILANEAETLLQNWTQVLGPELGLDELRVLEVGEIGKLEEARENFVVPILIGWTYQHSWITEPEALPLRRLPINIVTE